MLKPLEITYDRYSMVLNGQPEVIRSGAMHYFRLPDPQLWEDRLYKLKAAGYNTVDLYFCWAYHSKAPGEYDFSGNRDIGRLLKITQDLGLYVIARPGPYINAEYTAGGLPGWLLAKPEVVLRHRTEGGGFLWCEAYHQYVKEWWEQVVPFICNAPNVIMMQIENEYATLEVEPEPIQSLYDLARELGVKVPLSHNDLYGMGLYEDIVDIYAFDNYSVTQFDTNWREMDGVFSFLDTVEDAMRPYCEERPLMVAELQAGWFATWKGYAYRHIVETLGREHIGLSTKTLLAQGLTIFNHYKAIGGTNWDTIGSTDTYTSYDFGAPISEAGLNTIRLFEAKAINLLLQSFDLARTLAVDLAEAGMTVTPEEAVLKVRRHAERAHEQWVFLRNLATAPVEANVAFGDESFTVDVKAHECLILPCNIPLTGGMTLAAASLEPLYQNPDVLLMKATRAGKITLKSDAFRTLETPPLVSGDAITVELKEDVLTLSILPLAEDGYESIQIGAFRVVFLGQALVDRTWVDEGGAVTIGVDAMLPGGHFGVQPDRKDNHRVYRFPAGSATVQKTVFSPKEDAIIPDLPTLKAWRIANASVPLTDSTGYGAVNGSGADFDSLGVYEGSGWYRLTLPGDAKRLMVDARHLWAAFLNGYVLAQGEHLVLTEGEDPPDPHVIDLQDVDFPTAGEDGENELVIFVDGLGHPKGFHDDARTPQGLLMLEVDGVNRIGEVLFQHGLALNQLKKSANGCAEAPIVSAITTFVLAEAEDVYRPLGVQLPEVTSARVNVYLNGVLLGRHWDACQRQTLYYLPEGILKPAGEENALQLVMMDFDPMLSTTAAPAWLGHVRLAAYGTLVKVGV